MKIDANTPERDEFDGDPLNPKHIEAVCGYLKNSPRDNLKKQALEIIVAMEAQIEDLKNKLRHSDDEMLATQNLSVMKTDLIGALKERIEEGKQALDIEKLANDELLKLLKKKNESFISRIVLWFKGEK